MLPLFTKKVSSLLVLPAIPLAWEDPQRCSQRLSKVHCALARSSNFAPDDGDENSHPAPQQPYDYDDDKITTIHCRKQPEMGERTFDLTAPIFRKEHWGRKPLLWRKAFDPSELVTNNSWPSWDDMMELVYDQSRDGTEKDESEHDNNMIEDETDINDDFPTGGIASASARLIRHLPGKLDSYTLDYPPFPSIHQLQLDDRDQGRAWTILVNDVDYYMPALADWLDDGATSDGKRMTTTFGSIPRWRRDDAQISCANAGGGIGPHVDNYDVWLIQTSGRRDWKVLPPSAGNAKDNSSKLDWIPGLDVAILRVPALMGIDQKDNVPTGDDDPTDANVSAEMICITLEPGDCLYLPPRWIHWGTAVSDQCQTLSVGCRTPSAAQLVARVAESLLEGGSSNSKNLFYGGYQHDQHQNSIEKDDDNNNQQHRRPFPSLTHHDKEGMKQLVRDALEAVMENDREWDELVGKIATEPMRYLDIHHQDIAEEVEEMNTKEHHYASLFPTEDQDPRTNNNDTSNIGIQRTSGVSMATTQLRDIAIDGETVAVDRFYAMGRLWELQSEPEAARYLNMIASGKVIPATLLSSLTEPLRVFFASLLQAGVIETVNTDQETA